MENLLDYIAATMGMIYLSDLRTDTAPRKRILSVLKNIPENKFPLAEWTEATRYIFGDDTISPSSEGEARALFRNEKSRWQ